MSTLNGTDVSSYQGPTPNYTNCGFVFVKATQGTGYTNPYHGSQVNKARAEARGVGHYHFAQGLDPVAEADYFWRATGWRVGEPLAVDAESPFWSNVSGDPVQWLVRFVTEIHRVSGLWPLVYMNKSDLFTYDFSPLVRLGCGLWGAAYNSTGFGDSQEWPFVAIWQNADTHYYSHGDSDIFFGDINAFHRYGTPAGYVVPQSAPAPAPVAPKPKPPTVRHYTIVSGDTLSSISTKLGVPVSTLQQRNGIPDANKIYAGQVLAY